MVKQYFYIFLIASFLVAIAYALAFLFCYIAGHAIDTLTPPELNYTDFML